MKEVLLSGPHIVQERQGLEFQPENPSRMHQPLNIRSTSTSMTSCTRSSWKRISLRKSPNDYFLPRHVVCNETPQLGYRHSSLLRLHLLKISRRLVAAKDASQAIGASVCSPRPADSIMQRWCRLAMEHEIQSQNAFIDVNGISKAIDGARRPIKDVPPQHILPLGGIKKGASEEIRKAPFSCRWSKVNKGQEDRHVRCFRVRGGRASQPSRHGAAVLVLHRRL